MAEETGPKLAQSGNGRERDDRGRFVKGHYGMGGRPPGPTTADLRAAIRSATKPDDIVSIFTKAIDQGKHGNDPARRFVFTTLGLIEILVDVTSAGERIDNLDAATIAEALAILGSANGSSGGGAA